MQSSAFVFVFTLTRLIGRRELSSLQPFDLMLLIVIGDLIQQGVTQNDLSVTGLVLTVGVFGLMTLAASYLGFRFPRIRPILEPEPLILVEDGNVIERNLKKERMTAGRARGRGPHPADRFAGQGQMGRARVRRADQLHPEVRLSRNPRQRVLAGTCSFERS